MREKLINDGEKSKEGENILSRVSHSTRSASKILLFWIHCQGVLLCYRMDNRTLTSDDNGHVIAQLRCANRDNHGCTCTARVKYVKSEMNEDRLIASNWQILELRGKHTSLNGPGRNT